MKPPKHFILTRLGLGIFRPRWYEEMVALFLAVTAPSLQKQTSQDFEWLIVIDVGMPIAQQLVLQSFTNAHENFHLVHTDVTKMSHMRLGGHDWVYQPCHEYILGRRLVEDPTEYVITSMIDADDAWARTYIESVNTFFDGDVQKLLETEAKRKFHLRHSAGRVLTYPKGCRWFVHNDAIQPIDRAYHSNGISIIARLSSGLSGLSHRHNGWRSGAEIAAFETVEQQSANPMWLYVLHNLNDSKWFDEGALVDRKKNQEIIEKEFGVDLAKITHWHNLYGINERTDHTGCDPADRYSRLFRLTALNRQIAALEKFSDDNPETRRFADRQRSVRDAVLKDVIEDDEPS